MFDHARGAVPSHDGVLNSPPASASRVGRCVYVLIDFQGDSMEWRAKKCPVVVAVIATLAIAAQPASAGYGLYASCTITADDPQYGFVQNPSQGTAGYGVYGFISLKCLQGETVAMQGRLQKYVNGTWTTVSTGRRTPASGYQTLGGGGTAGTINSGVSTTPCGSGTYRTWNLASINGTHHSAYSANRNIAC